MEFLFVLLLIVIIANVVGSNVKTLNNGKHTIIKKQCPPHQWFWQEIVDQDGNKQGERIACKVCGPLSQRVDGSVE